MNDSTESKLKTFNGTPITASLFLRHIGEHAAKKGYLTLLLRSYYISKHDQIVVANADLIPVFEEKNESGEDIQYLVALAITLPYMRKAAHTMAPVSAVDCASMKFPAFGALAGRAIG